MVDSVKTADRCPFSPSSDTWLSREREQALLREAGLRTAAGQGGPLLIYALSGMGKTSLVNTLREPIAERAGLFIHVCSDPAEQHAPYSPISKMWRALIADVNLPHDTRWGKPRRDLRDMLGLHAGILTDIFPVLGDLIGGLPPVPALGPVEARDRFEAALDQVIRVLSVVGFPIVLFFDDLHWFDQASLHIFRAFVCKSRGNLMVIGTYDPSRLEVTNPLSDVLAEVRACNDRLIELDLPPLPHAKITAMIDDMLDTGRHGDASPAAAIMRKTGGNPLLVKEFLRLVQDQQHLVFNTEARRWDWDQEAISQVHQPENAVVLVLRRLKLLPRGLRTFLALGSCFGRQFDLRDISRLTNMSLANTARTAARAIHEQLVTPLHDADLVIHQLLDEADVPRDKPILLGFQHESFQCAAYELSFEEQKRWFRLEIGRMLVSSLPPNPSARELCLAAGLLRKARGDIRQESERLRLAEVCFLAGEKAWKCLAHTMAARYFSDALELLPIRAWTTHYRQAFRLHYLYWECALHLGFTERADRLVRTLLQCAQGRYDRAIFHHARLNKGMIAFNWEYATEMGCKGLMECGADFPFEAGGHAVAAEAVHLAAMLTPERIKRLTRPDQTCDPLTGVAVNILGDLAAVGYLSGNKMLMRACVLRAMTLLLRHGNAEGAGYIFAWYANVLTESGAYEQAHTFSLVTERWVQANPLAVRNCRALSVIGALVLYYKEPFANAVKVLGQGSAIGCRSGDLLIGYQCLMLSLYYLFAGGYPLAQLQHKIKEIRALKGGAIYDALVDITLAYSLLAITLTGTRVDGVCDWNCFSAEAWRRIESSNNLGVILHCRFQSAFWSRESNVLEIAEEAERALPHIEGHIQCIEHHLLHVLVLCRLYESVSIKERRRFRGIMATKLTKMAALAVVCPGNFAHKHHLMAAEIARAAGGRAAEIEAHYRAAHTSAAANGFNQYEALAAELYSTYLKEGGQAEQAEAVQQRAIEAYTRWGAQARTETAGR